MNKTRIKLVIAFSIFALIGSIVVQYYWVRELYNQNEILFEQNIHQALKYAVNNIQKEEDKYRINRFFVQPKVIAKPRIKERLEKIQQQHYEAVGRRTSEVIVHTEARTRNNNEVFVYSDSDTDIDFFNFQNNFLVYGDSDLETGIRIKIENDSISQKFENKADSLIKVLEYKTIDLKKEKEKLETTIDQLVWEMDEWTSPFYDSIPADLINNAIADAMIEYGLPESFEFAVLSEADYLYRTEKFDQEPADYKYVASLYPDYLIPRQQMLVLQVASNIMYYKMSGPILLSVLFTLMLTSGLWLIIRNLIHHRNISQIQNDFINNMTHEFKTPIATISLASDSILNPNILDKQEKVSYFTGMIKKENKRMNRLVEKILQMARLENKEFKLEKQKVAIHDMLQMIGENTKIKLKESGDISIRLNAQNDTVLADQLHLTNVFYNLIDNAIKYSEEPKNIEIETLNQKAYILIRFKDNGHGMNKKELQHIFDRFYRIEAGNVHNIKGYGLGLTYVKAVIEKHSGQINVKSEPGIGSTFEIKLPV